MTAVTVKVFRLYRIFDDDGALIYVGETDDTLRRWLEHLKKQPWSAEIADVRRDRRVFYSKADVQAAEKAAVEAERPRFNIEYNQRNRDRVDPRTMRFPDGRLYRPDLYHRDGAESQGPSHPSRRGVTGPSSRSRRPAKPKAKPKARSRSMGHGEWRVARVVATWLAVFVLCVWAGWDHGSLRDTGVAGLVFASLAAVGAGRAK